MKRSLAITGLVLLLAAQSDVCCAQWVRIGPIQNIYGLDTDPQGHYLFAHTGSGILSSSDLGLNWQTLNIGPANLVFINSNEMIAGTGSGSFYKSSDYGDQWDSIGTLSNSLTALCWTGNTLIAGTLSSGFFLSSDTGRSWIPIDSGFPMPDGITVFEISALMACNGYIYAGTTYSFGGAEGAIRSKIGTYIWQQSDPYFNGMNVTGFAHIGPNVFVSTYDYESGNGVGVYRSTDSGTTWWNAGFPPPYEGVTSITYSAPYLITGHHDFGVFISSDSGNTWLPSAGIPTYPDGWIDIDGLATEDGFVFAAVSIDSGGLYRRPLSDFGISSVTNTPSSPLQIQSYPNPFSSRATITFTNQTEGYAEVTIVNLLGSQVARLFAGELAAGEHSFTWDAGKDACTTGMYECVVNVGGHTQRVSLVHLQ